MKKREYTARDNMMRAIAREGFGNREIRVHTTVRESDGRRVYEPEILCRTDAEKYQLTKRGFRASIPD